MSTALDTREVTYLVRQATLPEVPFVIECIRRLHHETQPYRSLIAPGPRTEAWIARTAEEAWKGNGVILVAVDEGGAPVAALLAAEMQLPYNNALGRIAAGIGTYVMPPCRKLGIAHALYQEAISLLKGWGYDTYLGGRLLDNAPVRGVLSEVGFEDVDVTVTLNLRGR